MVEGAQLSTLHEIPDIKNKTPVASSVRPARCMFLSLLNILRLDLVCRKCIMRHVHRRVHNMARTFLYLFTRSRLTRPAAPPLRRRVPSDQSHDNPRHPHRHRNRHTYRCVLPTPLHAYANLTPTRAAVVAILVLVLFLAFPADGYYICGVLVIAKLYSTSLLVLFNSRMHIVGGRNEYSCSAEIWPRISGETAEWISVQRIGPFTSASQLGPVAVRELLPLGSVYIDVGGHSVSFVSARALGAVADQEISVPTQRF